MIFLKSLVSIFCFIFILRGSYRIFVVGFYSLDIKGFFFFIRYSVFIYGVDFICEISEYMI